MAVFLLHWYLIDPIAGCLRQLQNPSQTCLSQWIHTSLYVRIQSKQLFVTLHIKKQMFSPESLLEIWVWLLYLALDLCSCWSPKPCLPEPHSTQPLNLVYLKLWYSDALHCIWKSGFWPLLCLGEPKYTQTTKAHNTLLAVYIAYLIYFTW